MDSASSNPETETTKQPAEREVPVTVSGRCVGARDGESFTEETVTNATFESGGVVRLSTEMVEGQIVRIRNKKNGREVASRVTKRQLSDGDAKWVELEFTEPEPDFWRTPATSEEGPASTATEGQIEIPKLEEPPAAAEVPQQTEHSNAAETAAPNEEPPAWMKVNKAWEGGESYPIRMNLPKAGESSPRTAEFAADSATITAAQDEYLLPKPNLDFEQFPGLAEQKTKLLSGTARRSLSGPIGVVVVIALLLIAGGVGAYRLGWLSKKSAQETVAPAEQASTTTATSAATNTSTEVAAPPAVSSVPPSTQHATPPKVGNETVSISTITPTNNVSMNASAHSSKAVIAPKTKTKDVPESGVPQEEVYVPPKLIKAIRSLSPPEALRAYASGVVILDTTVDENGKVISTTPVSGPKALYEKAAETVKEGYVYQPATRNGKPVQAHVEVKIQFWYEP